VSDFYVRPYKSRSKDPRKQAEEAWEYHFFITRPDGTVYEERRRARPAKPTYEEAVKWALKRRAEVIKKFEKGDQPKVKTGSALSIYEDTYITACKAARQSPSGISSKKSHFRKWLIPTLGALRLSDITTKQVERLKAALMDQSPTHTNNVLGTLSACLHYAVEVEDIWKMPCKIVLVPEEPPLMTFYERPALDAILLAAGDGHLAMVLLGSDAGLRAGEMVGLERGDIDFTRNEIHIQRAVWRGHVKLPKSGKSRRVPMTKRLRAALLAIWAKGTTRIFPDATRNVLSDWLADCERAASLEVKGYVHKLRHTFCSHLALRNVPAHVIKDLAGHHDLSVTQRYMHLAGSSKTDAVAVLEAPEILKSSEIAAA